MVSLNNKSFYDHFGGGDRTKNGITKQNTILRVSTKLPRGNWRMKNLTKRMEKNRWICSLATIFFGVEGGSFFLQNHIGNLWKCENKSDHFVHRHHPSYPNDRTWKFHFNRIWKRMSCKFLMHTQNYRSINMNIKHFVSTFAHTWNSKLILNYKMTGFTCANRPTNRPKESNNNNIE